MYISQESGEQTESRLRLVIQQTELVWHEGAYAFYEYPSQGLPFGEVSGALALVRDEDVWSVLKKADPTASERFGVFSFHFPDQLDNSGFVGWLASIMKREIGTGVFVVCGQNSKRGGIFDYWGVPISAREAAAELLRNLRRRD